MSKRRKLRKRWHRCARESEERLRSRIPEGYRHFDWQFDETPFGPVLSAFEPEVGMHIIGSAQAMSYATAAWHETCYDVFGAPPGPPIVHGFL